MNKPEILRSEETGSDYAPPSEFNIAGAFPVTDRLVREVERRKRKARMNRVVRSLRCRCFAAGLIGFLIGAGAARSGRY